MPDSDETNSKLDESLIDKRKQSFKLNRRVIISFIATVVLLISSGLILYFVSQQNNSSKKSLSREVCIGELLDIAVDVLNPIDLSKSSQLDELNNKIILLDGYKKDPNCLYPVMQNYVFKGDLTNAIETFNSFESVYGDGSAFASVRFAKNIESLRKQNEIYKQQLEQLKNGSGSQTFGKPRPKTEEQNTQ